MKNHKLIPIFFLLLNFLILNCFEPCSVKGASIYVLSEGSSINTDLNPKSVGYYQITATSAGVPIKVYVYIKPENRELTDISLFSPQKSLISWDSIYYDSMKMRYIIDITPRSTGKYLLSIENKDDYSININTSYKCKSDNNIKPRNTEKPSSHTSAPVMPKPKSTKTPDAHTYTPKPVSSKTSHPNPTRTPTPARTGSPTKVPTATRTNSPTKTPTPAKTNSPTKPRTTKPKQKKPVNHTTSGSSSKKKKTENNIHTHTSKPSKNVDIELDLSVKHPVFHSSLIFLHTNPKVLSRFTYILKPELFSAAYTDEILTYNNIKIAVLDPELASYNSGYISVKKAGITTVVAVSEERIIDCFTLKIFDKEEKF